ncbi:hypothetical protein D7319_11170 [Streptomyces radicis]|uniref:Uncharacterized protein n=1 Tax=Streptomyces radicis TaxID=1750517 RepID=A0A3A9WU37_9ACTN|nr:hypothetical protein D7319_11170 [Streptomyces radicis]
MTAGEAHGDRFSDVHTAVLGAAWLSREEDGSPGTEMDNGTALLVGSLHAEAEETARTNGEWRILTPDRWADVLIHFTP